MSERRAIGLLSTRHAVDAPAAAQLDKSPGMVY